MKTAIIKRVTASPLYKAWVDGDELVFTGDAANADVAPGSHALTWVVHGPVGSTYGIAIASPRESRLDYSATFDSTQKDAGLHWFEVGA